MLLIKHHLNKLKQVSNVVYFWMEILRAKGVANKYVLNFGIILLSSTRLKRDQPSKNKWFLTKTWFFSSERG